MENADPRPPRTIVRRTPEEWDAVRRRLEAGETPRALAEELGVSVRTVQRQRGLTPKPGRKTPRSLTSAEEAEVCRLSLLGHYAKDLAPQFDVCLSTIRNTLKRLACRPCDRNEPRNLARSKRSNADVRKAVVETRATAADRFVMDLPDGASFGEAARAAALSAVAHLKEASPSKCQQYLKSAQMLEAADQRATGGWGDPFADTPGRRAALDILREAHGAPGGEP